eukprot:3885856-Rhodomonas_salina.1
MDTTIRPTNGKLPRPRNATPYAHEPYRPSHTSRTAIRTRGVGGFARWSGCRERGCPQGPGGPTRVPPP